MEQFLYQEIESLRNFGQIKECPECITKNLNPAFELRKYQKEAFENFVTWYESERRPYPLQNLFHMATGSGKTLIMAGLMLYLYKKGYRNFLFFVNLTNIVQKTKDNFMNHASGKYLFAEEIVIDGECVPVKEVSNFQYSDENAINILFTTTQGLYTDIWTPKENSITVEDFRLRKIVYISDEAHHLNVDTRKLCGKEEENYHSWESTVRNIFEMNRDNVLLEFTATCDLKNEQIRAAYVNKIVFNYPLVDFRLDLYSKEIKTMRCDIDVMDRAIQAIVLSQYRKKIFQDYRLAIKPVVLFKSAKIGESKSNMSAFISAVEALTGDELRRISNLTNNETMLKVWGYFASRGVSFEQLAQELKEDFSVLHCLSVNDDSEAGEKQLVLNSLEDNNNPYRAIFEVKKLDEGWDVLNLFDIVRMYETRQSSGKKISPSTLAEAQLIGRGARYCPFRINDEQEKYKRKYDRESENPLRICEELYYHCQNDSRYINELNSALREIGINLDARKQVECKLKESFRCDNLYKQGYVFINKRTKKTRNDVYGLPAPERERIYTYHAASGNSGEDVLLSEDTARREHVVETKTYSTTFADIAKINYAIVHKALCRYNDLRFDVLRGYFPNLRSTREFIESGDYIGDIRLEIISPDAVPNVEVLHKACLMALSKIADSISSIRDTYEGTKKFSPKYIHEIFKDKICYYTSPHDGGVGISQNDRSVPPDMKLDLSQEDWFAFEDNFGTSEEKIFVKYFKDHIDELRKKYDKVYLVRNERQLQIYSFSDGERFEPDYVLFLQANKTDSFEQFQIFIEPKGSHLIAEDKWKEDFLLELEKEAIPVVRFVDDNEYRIWGFHFFNRECRMREIDADFSRL